MPRLLIAGFGYLGQAIAELFVAERWDIEGWTASAESAEELSGKSYPVRAVDISNEIQVGAEKETFDAVIHSASTRGGDVDLYRRVYLTGVRSLLRQFGHSRLLFVSSTSVYAQNTGEWVGEESPAEPAHESGKVLREAENLVLSNRGIVVRLGGIYGPGRSALLKKFLSGEAVVDPEKDRFANAIHRDDAARAIQFLLLRPESAGEIYNLVDNEPTLQSEGYRWLAAKLNQALPPTGRSISSRKRGESNKRVSNAKLRALGWAPRYPNFRAGLEENVLPNWAQESA